ncbi:MULTISPECIES: hypothetical protein [Myxococcus]|uniref:Uncharacterized protein n=1 Tax=Myxococcus llanfairpwllgwyngyllgogerychwyrndrobwllllantysiliogogogochensis TaxID=2590453 RepID=A0A540WQF2_9BACT|nr:MULTISPECIES: hypothetical protein [Myxococcus]NTX03431.1 hypothetical protein [Myxococcus sp. CA040A]NTX11837.1 hypothetical protein [Myxococcus sp. CA056]NTX34061.1 hypothetical protein [Myxococcus sp. CA033]NTX56491.1 hypothetical protein [Myxococcus sp. CA039A]TQF11243.1 hypothetical protein FJV41_35310 [Myxococcus llanfairpwllgwyngyllgogerychwyrndrobwllllantysiliogogogochensis]
MPELKPLHVVLILAIVAIVALYVLGVGLGAKDESSRRESPTQSAQELRERFIKPEPVDATELAATCAFQEGVLVLPSGGSCRVDVKASDTRMRSLEVVPRPLSVVRVSLASRGKPSVPAKFDPLKEAKKLDVAKEGADLEVTCLSAPPQRPICELGLR